MSEDGSLARRPGRNRRRRPGRERSGGKTGRGSEHRVPVVAAVQTTPDGQPQIVCLRQQPFPIEVVAVFAARNR